MAGKLINMFKTNVCFVLCQQHVNMSENQNLGFLGKPRLFTWDLLFFQLYSSMDEFDLEPSG